MTEAPAPRDAIALAADIRSGAADPAEVLEQSISRIKELNPALNAVVATRFDEARAEVEAGLPDGPLRGVPILIKILGTDVKGLPATDGSRLFTDVIATVDSTVVQRYKAAGMVVVGMTNAPEFGKTTTTEPLLYGPCHNPWNTEYFTGGSSGGSAASAGPTAAGPSGFLPPCAGWWASSRAVAGCLPGRIPSRWPHP